MHPNKFDQYFRDKLLDHSTKVSPSAWKMIHAGLLRHKAFHLWKWYVAGPSIVVIALTGHMILAQINKPDKAHAGPSTHIPTQPTATTAAPATIATPPVNTATAGTTTPPTTTDAPDGTIHETASSPTTNSTPVADGTVHKLHTTSGTGTTITSASTNTRSLSNTNIRLATNTRHATKTRLATNTHPASGAHIRREPRSRSETGPLTSDAPSTEASSSEAVNARQSHSTFTHRPAPLTTRPTIVRPAIRLAVTAKTPNPGSSKSLSLPSVPYQPTNRWRFDGSASPEYFSFKELGFSYGAGARATFVFKQHYTITAGIQYLKVDVRAGQKGDSLNSLFPGIFNNIQVPLLFGYTTGNQRFSVGVNAGAIFSLYAEAKGRLKDYGWPNRNGITSYLGFNFATRVNDRISLFAEPYIKYWYPQKFQNLPPRLFSTGISIGLRYDLK